MAAFRQAVERWGADMLETDVHATADGRLVVIHDPTVDRTTNGTGAVAEMAWDEIRELDAGYRFVDLEGRNSFRGIGVGIPLFEELLAELPGIRVNVDAKVPGISHLLREEIRKHGAESRVLVAAEFDRHRKGIRGYPGPWGAGREQITRFFLAQKLGRLGRFYTPRADALQVPDFWEGRQILSPRFVREAHTRNIPVHPWTIDDEDDMRRLLSWGVDGIQTDRPDILARVLHEEFGRPLPPGLAEAS
jgi:glycerophosphoryl diester phosphodiesterase